jgi:C-terminal processing protease CtpA/Prc
MFDQAEANKLISRARKEKALILDLRQNPGGAVETLEAVVGGIFDHDVKISDRVGRDCTKPYDRQVESSRLWWQAVCAN